MKRSISPNIFFLFLLIIPVLQNLHAQDEDLDNTLSNLSSNAAEAYVHPVVNGFGSNLNSGWFAYPPDPVKIGLTLRLRVVANGTFFNEEDQNFSSEGMFRFTSQQADNILAASGYSQSHPRYSDIKREFLDKEWGASFSGPTIIGSEDDNVEVDFQGGTLIVDGQEVEIDPYKVNLEEVTGYLDDLKLLPSPNLQLTAGTFMGTNFTFRWFPSIDIQDLGKFSFYGVGLIHNTNVWLDPDLPVDVSLGFFYQSLEVGDIFETSAVKYGLHISKTFGLGFAFSPYLGLSMESSETSVSYDYMYDTDAGKRSVKINFDSEGDNNFAATIGFTVKLVVASLNIDYKIANSNTLTAGLSIGIL